MSISASATEADFDLKVEVAHSGMKARVLRFQQNAGSCTKWVDDKKSLTKIRECQKLKLRAEKLSNLKFFSSPLQDSGSYYILTYSSKTAKWSKRVRTTEDKSSPLAPYRDLALEALKMK